MTALVVSLMFAVCAISTIMVVNHRLRMLLGIEWGLSMIALGTFLGAITIAQDESCIIDHLIPQAGLVGAGLLLMLISYLRRSLKNHGQMRRHADIELLKDDDYSKIHGRGPQ